MDYGPLVSYEVLAPGTKVLSADGKEVGTVVHVLADESQDVFDGLVIAERAGSGEHRFADADDIQEIHEGAVLLKLSGDAAAHLPRPTANAAVMRDDPGAPASSPLGDKLRRAWDLISGNY